MNVQQKARKAGSRRPLALGGRFNAGETTSITFFVFIVLISITSATVASLAAPIIALCFAVPMIVRSRDLDYVTFAFWMWVSAPLLRRIVDLHGFQGPNSLILIVPIVVSVAGLFFTLVRPHVKSPSIFVATAFALLYALVSGVLQNGLTAAFVATIGYLAPIGLGLFVVNARVDQADLTACIGRNCVLGALFLGAYGLVQWVLLPPWDRRWMQNVADKITSFGLAKPFDVRVFSSLNSPGTLALVLVFLMLVVSQFPRWRISTIATSVGLVALAISQVRVGWIAFAIAAVCLALAGRPDLFKIASIGTATFLVMGLLLPQANTVVAHRFSATTAAGASDYSLQTRIHNQSAVLPHAFMDPLGLGAGSAGASARLSSQDNSGFVNTDSTLVEVLRVMGGLMGGMFIAIILSWSVFACRRLRHDDPLQRACAAYATSVPFQLVFGIVTSGAIAMVLWLAIGLTLRSDPVRQSKKPPPDRRPHLRAAHA